jgi:hypothetical protein
VQVSRLAGLPDRERVLALGYLELLRYAQRLRATVSGHARMASTPLHSTPALPACVELPYLASALTVVLVAHGLLVPVQGTSVHGERYGRSGTRSSCGPPLGTSQHTCNARATIQESTQTSLKCLGCLFVRECCQAHVTCVQYVQR